MPTKYLFIFAQVHHEFRIPEILSVAELNGFNVVLPGAPDDLDITRPFMILGLYKEDHAVILAKRCILVKSARERVCSYDRTNTMALDPSMSSMHRGLVTRNSI
jgi:tRNA (guanine10-N2)-methyltransferase